MLGLGEHPHGVSSLAMKYTKQDKRKPSSILWVCRMAADVYFFGLAFKTNCVVVVRGCGLKKNNVNRKYQKMSQSLCRKEGGIASPIFLQFPRVGSSATGAVFPVFGICGPWEGKASLQPSLLTTVFLIPLIQPSIESCRHQAGGQSPLPQEIVVALPPELVRGVQGHPRGEK